MNEFPEQDNEELWMARREEEYVPWLDDDGNITANLSFYYLYGGPFRRDYNPELIFFKRSRFGNTLLERDPEPLGTGVGLREYTTAATSAEAAALAVYGHPPLPVVIHPDDTSRVLSGKRAVEETYGPLSVWDVSGVADLSFLFVGWHDFSGDVSGWNVRGVRSMRGMFWDCENFNSNLAGWDVSTVRDFGCMFRRSTFNGCIGSWRVQSDAYLDGMFEACRSLTPASVASLESWDLKKCVNQWQGFTVPLSNAISGKLIEVKLASRASTLTVEQLKRSVARQWKQSEGLKYENWRAVEILVSEADARLLKGEEDVGRETRLVSGRSLCEPEAAAFGSSDSEEEILGSPSLVTLEPDTLEFDPEKFAGLVTSTGPSKSDAEPEESRARLHFFVRGFARFESRRELSAALRTMQAAEYIAMRMNEAPVQDNEELWMAWRDEEYVPWLDDDENITVNLALIYGPPDYDDPPYYNREIFLKQWRLGNTLLERDLEPSGTGLGLREYTTAATRAYASAVAVYWRRPNSSDIEALIHPDDYSRVLSGKRAVEETYGPLSVWDVSGVADLSFLFVGWQDFCGDVSGWNVCGVRSMRGMFWGCEDFNSNLAGWDVSTVRDFGCMFRNSKFNGCIGSWKVRSDAYLDGMFEGNSNLTPDAVASLESWDLCWKYASVWQVYGMFSGCYRLDWDSLPSWLWRWPSLIRFVLKPWLEIPACCRARVLAGKCAVEEIYGPLSLWDVSGVEDLSFLFASWWDDFSGDVSGWNVRGVRWMQGMFFECRNFNCSLADWDVSTVRDFGGMFRAACSFNQPLGVWNVGNSEYMGGMFEFCDSLTPASIASLESWDFKLSSVGEWDIVWDLAEGHLGGPFIVNLDWELSVTKSGVDDYRWLEADYRRGWEYDEYDFVLLEQRCNRKAFGSRRGRLRRQEQQARK
eukprot:g6914.t1